MNVNVSDPNEAPGPPADQPAGVGPGGGGVGDGGAQAPNLEWDDDDQGAFGERLRQLVPKPQSVQRQIEESLEALRRSAELLRRTTPDKIGRITARQKRD
jgi:hypothetical protein